MAYTLIGLQVITASGAGTYTPTSGTGIVVIELVGAGGGGGSSCKAVPNDSVGSGGGGGAYIKTTLFAHFSGASYVVGAHGAGGVDTGGGVTTGNAGAAGGDTTFTDTAGSPTVYTAGGGGAGSWAGGGSSIVTAATAGGAPTNGDIQEHGGPAGVGFATGSIFVGWSGAGGKSRYSSGGAGVNNPGSAATAGSSAGGYGGGGGGSYAHNALSGASGGAGSNGLILIWEYAPTVFPSAITIDAPALSATGTSEIDGTIAITIDAPTLSAIGNTFTPVPVAITQHSLTVVRYPQTFTNLTQHSLTVVRIANDEVDFENDRTPGLTHVEITLSDGSVQAWSSMPMDDPLTYDYGRKVSRVLSWNDIRRTVCDFYGQPVAADFRFVMRDKDLHALGYLGDPGNVFINRYTVTRSITDADRRKQLIRRVIFRGPIRGVAPRPGATHEFTLKDYLQERFGPNSDVAALPRRKVNLDFPQSSVSLVTSSAEGYATSGGHSIGDTDIAVTGGVGTYAADEVVFANHGTVYSVTASSLTEPETTFTVSPALTADVPDGTVITQNKTHNVSPAFGNIIPIRAGIRTDFKVIGGEDNGDGRGKSMYVGDEVMSDGHTYAIFVWACHGCYSPEGKPFQMLYWWNGAIYSAGSVSYQQGNDIVAHAIGDLATEAGTGGRILLPGYQNWSDNGFSETFVDRNSRRYTIYGLRGILRDMALGIRGAPVNLGGVPHSVNAYGADSSLNGHGSLVRDIHDQLPFFFNSFFWGDYQSGPPLPNPTFPDDPKLTLLDLDSIAAAKAHAQSILTGGFVGDWSIGVDNEQITMATFIQWMIRCMGVEQSWNRRTQFMVDRLNFDPDAAMADAPTLTDERDIQQLSFGIDEAPDEQFTALPFVHTIDELGRASTGWRSSTADFNVASQVDEYDDDQATILKYNPTGVKLYSQQLEFRLLQGKNTSHDADEAQQGSDTINAILRYKLDMAKVRRFSLTTWGKGYSIEMFDRLWIQHLANVGGRTPRPVRVVEHDAQPDRWRVTLKCFDILGVLGDTITTITGNGNITIGPPAVDTSGDVTGTENSSITADAPTLDAIGDAGPNEGIFISGQALDGVMIQIFTGTSDFAIDAPLMQAKNTPDDSTVTIDAPSFSGTGTIVFGGTAGVAIDHPTVSAFNSGGVLIQTTDVANTVINAHPAGTAFTIQSGLHRDSISPRNGDIYTGQDGAIFSGAILLSSAAGSNPWHYINQHQQLPYDTAGGAAYQSGHDASGHPENVYYDNNMLEMVSALGDGGTGKAFFDYPNATIYIWDNPSGHTVECSVLQTAVAAANVGATYTNIVFEKYASLTQGAAVTLGGGNVMTNCEVRLCHYAGVETGPGAQFIGGYVHHNGVFGFVGSGSNALIQGVEIAFNNMVNVFGQPFWGAGGAKWVQSDGLVVRGCNSHDNDGPGLWTDINNINVTYDGNTCYNNTFCGIFQEIGYDAIIKNNTCSNNGATIALLYGKWPQAANICFCDSRNVQIFNNTVNDGYWGISFLQDDRGAGSNPDQTHGLWQVTGFTGHNNIINNPLYAMVGGFGPDGDNSWYTSRGNSWSNNTFNNSHGATYEWGGSTDLNGFHAKGQS